MHFLVNSMTTSSNKSYLMQLKRIRAQQKAPWQILVADTPEEAAAFDNQNPGALVICRECYEQDIAPRTLK